MTREWTDEFNPFNSMKVMSWADHMTAIVNEDYLPPVVVNLDVAGVCNYLCTHCHHRSKQIKDRSLPFLDERLARTFPKFLAGWLKNGQRPAACCIVGSKGDALLYDHLPALLKDLHFQTIDVGLVTNGYAFTDGLIDFAAHYCKFVGFSMDAGSKRAYNAVHNPPDDAWEKVLENISKLVTVVNQNNLRNDIGFKVLVFPESQHTIYEACNIAFNLGVRYVQIRPADLSEEARREINIEDVNDQIERAMDDFNEPGEFEIVGVRHKFTADFKKRLPKYCYLTALTVTITSDGKCWPCVDRRWDEPTLLADCGSGAGWSALRDVWGSAKHIEIIHGLINNNGCGPTCNIRCSNFGYTQYFERAILNDDMDRTLI